MTFILLLDFNEPIKKSKTFSKAVSESSNNLAPKPNFQAVSAKVLNQNNIVPNSVKEPAKPNVNVYKSYFFN